MTASRRRRNGATLLSFLVALVSMAAVAALGLAGVRTLADSSSGRRAEGQVVRQTQRLAHTATALLGVVDDDGRLTSVVVMVLRPDGVGGTVVGYSPSADVAFGIGGSVEPLDAIWRTGGAESLLAAMESMTSLSFDVVEVAEQRRFAQLITPLGDLPTDLPIPMRDGSTGEAWPAGDQTLTAPAAARVMTAFDPAIADWYLDPGRAGVWDAIAARVGAGIGSAEPVATDRALPPLRTVDDFLDRLYAAPVEFRALPFEPVPEDEARRRLSPDAAHVAADGATPSVVVQDRVESIMLLAALAPGRLGAPLEAPAFRIESNFTLADLAPVRPFSLDRTDLARAVVVRLLFQGANVVSVAELPANGTPAITRVRVADPTVVDAVTDYEEFLGPIEVSVMEVPIEGVDIVLTLGVSFAEHLRAGG